MHREFLQLCLSFLFYIHTSLPDDGALGIIFLVALVEQLLWPWVYSDEQNQYGLYLCGACGPVGETDINHINT